MAAVRVGAAEDDAPAADSLAAEVRRLRAAGETAGAERLCRRALASEPDHAAARRLLIELLTQDGRVAETLGLWREEVTRGGEAWGDGLIADGLGAEELEPVAGYAAAFAAARWGTADAEPVAAPPPRSLTVSKLRHDLDQLGYLRGRGLGGSWLDGAARAYAATLDRLAPLGPEGRAPFDTQAQKELGPFYNRLWHVRSSPRVPRALSSSWAPARVEQEYLDRSPGLVVIDDFLSLGALEELRSFCLESTLWFANRYGHGRLGAFVRDGFVSPLLLQIAEELRAALPRVIGDRYPLRQLWGFKNAVEQPPNAAVHADFAAVNVNFWTTADDANLDPSSGGLVVWEADAPPDWDFHTYNGRSDLIRIYLEQQNARRRVIPYRANRAIIFNSDLFHGTDALRFRPCYESRRINITLLYGQRERDAHHGRIAAAPAMGRGGWRSAALRR